jgi:hypothetical protein
VTGDSYAFEAAKIGETILPCEVQPSVSRTRTEIQIVSAATLRFLAPRPPPDHQTQAQEKERLQDRKPYEAGSLSRRTRVEAIGGRVWVCENRQNECARLRREKRRPFE